MNSEYDTSRDLIESEEGNLPANEEAFEKIFPKWVKRSWESRLNENHIFPFFVKGMEDEEDDAYFADIADHEPFRLGHVMKAIGFE